VPRAWRLTVLITEGAPFTNKEAALPDVADWKAYEAARAFEGLAPVVVKRFREAVLKIEDLGISLLIAESNLVNAARIADRLYAIDRGEIIFEGKPQQAIEDENVMKALRG